MFRAIVAAFALAAISTPALALEPSDLIGAWGTQWANRAGAEPEGGGAMRIAADTAPDALDGVLPGPGWDGLMHGEVTQEDGKLVWSGVWISYWPEGVTRGSFRFVFADAESFTGAWSTEDGEIVNAAWNGWRER